MSETPRTDAVKAKAQAPYDAGQVDYPTMLFQMVGALSVHARKQEAALSAAEQRAEAMGSVDTEAIAWAIAKMDAFGVSHSTMENALMVDRLTDMLHQASRAALASVAVDSSERAPTESSPETVVVPKIATDAMQLAGAEAIRIDTTPINKLWTARKVWDAMVLAASPGAQKGEA